MIPQPDGWLYKVDQIVHEYEALLIADEVMTGFGRTGIVKEDIKGTCLFACPHAGIRPDIMALSKGLTGGYLPLAATLTNAAVFEAFLGEYHEFKTFFHGHSYTANQLGCASALASLDILETPKNIKARQNLEKWMDLSSFWDFECVGDIRKVGLIAGIELVKDRSKRTPFALEEKVGMRVGEAMARRGVLTRPIGNIIVIMPPYCTTQAQMKKIISVLYESIEECVATAPGK